MYLSLNWLKEFVDIPRSITPQELGVKLTMHTLEIDSVKSEADKYKDVVVGRIIEVKKHPNADKLQLAKVNIGKRELNIVCGAFNIKPGQKVPVALGGAQLPNGARIEEAQVRGEISEGMLCAEDELGLGSDHSGILILDDKAKIGGSLGKYLDLKDVVYEVDNKSITNRPDLWGHYGIAREISAFLGVKMKSDWQRLKIDKIKIDSNSDSINVKVEDFKLCARYMAVPIKGIKIGESPKWIADRLIAIGIRPINNIVDITNYVMMEFGQPLHAFDRESADKIIVRPAKNGETIKTLDGEDRKLDGKDLVIADSRKAIAIAGIMGGENSEINPDTREIIIEAANFDFVSIRRTAQKLGLRTEASQRFEKSLDPALCETALARAVELIKKTCPKARAAGAAADEKKIDSIPAVIELDPDWLYRFTGIAVDEKRIQNILAKLGFKTEKKQSKINVTVPSWRAARDINGREDLAEEISRIIGYDNFTPVAGRIKMEAPEKNSEINLIRKIKQKLSGPAFMSEVYNYSFVSEEQLGRLKIDHSGYIRLLNPITEYHTMLRQSLAPNLFENIRKNQPRYGLIRLFEIGNIFLSAEGEIKKSDRQDGNLPYQEKRLGMIAAGEKKDDVIGLIKGALELLVDAEYLPIDSAPNWAEAGSSADIESGGVNIGSIYKLKSQIAKSMGIKKDTAVIEVGLKRLEEAIREKDEVKFREYEKYPPVIRDLAFVVDEKVLYNDIKEEILNFSDLIKKAELFDAYTGAKLGKGKKSLAFRVIYQADKTLRRGEVDNIQIGLFARLKDKFEAKIRDF